MATIVKKGTPKIHLIWSNDVDKMYPDEKERETMYHEHLEMNNLDENDYDLWEFLRDSADWHWEDEEMNLSCHEKKHGEKAYVIKASLGLWDGRKDEGLVVDKGGIITALQKCFEDYNTVQVEGKRCKVIAVHHDGTNIFEIKELTNRGYEYYRNHQYDKTRRELVETLFNDSHYSHEVGIFKEVYGWK